MNRIFDYIKGNKAGTSILAVVVACILGLAFASGCGSLDDMVKVNVPDTIQTATHSKGTIPLSKAIHVRRQYVTEVKFALDKFDQNIDGATAFRDLALSLLNTGMVAGQGALAGFPGGALLMSVLAGVGGLYLKKPGTDSEINSAKQDSFNAGQRRAISMQQNFIRTDIGDLVNEKLREAINASKTDTRSG